MLKRYQRKPSSVYLIEYDCTDFSLPSTAYIIRTIRCTRSRYHTYLYLAPLKVAVFALMGFLLHGLNFFDYFTLFLKAWHTHPITLTVLGGTQVKLIRQWNLLMYSFFSSRNFSTRIR